MPYITHSMSRTRIYATWANMRDRCQNPKSQCFKDYGGRGITVCDRWAKFENFYADIGPCPKGGTLERLNNDAGYGPTNCRWSTHKEQARNRRNSRLLEIDGKSKCLAEWSEIAGIAWSTIDGRLRSGMSPKEAVFTPADPAKSFSSRCRKL